jgi:hypothetical protein
MKTLRDIYELYAEPDLPYEIFKNRLYEFFVDLDEANAFAGGVWGPDNIYDNLEATE